MEDRDYIAAAMRMAVISDEGGVAPEKWTWTEEDELRRWNAMPSSVKERWIARAKAVVQQAEIYIRQDELDRAINSLYTYENPPEYYGKFGRAMWRSRFNIETLSAQEKVKRWLISRKEHVIMRPEYRKG